MAALHERLCSRSCITGSCIQRARSHLVSARPNPNHPVLAHAPARTHRATRCATHTAHRTPAHSDDSAMHDLYTDSPGITLHGGLGGTTFVVSGAATVSMPPGASLANSGGSNTFVLPPGAVITMPAGSGSERTPSPSRASERTPSPSRLPAADHSRTNGASAPPAQAAPTGHSPMGAAHSPPTPVSSPAHTPAAPSPDAAATTIYNGAGVQHAPAPLLQHAAPTFAPPPRAVSVASNDDAGNRRARRDGGESAEYHTHLTNRAQSTPIYSRVMLKVSGEALQGTHGFGTDPDVLKLVAEEVRAAYLQGIEICIVVGGGNYFRGASAWEGLNRATADYVGMLATVMNALCLQAALEQLRVPTRVQTAIEMREVAEPYVQRRAIRHLEEGRVVIFGAGTGNPFFTTDTAAALRAAEMDCDVFLKATKVDGVYDSDPKKNPAAKRYSKLSFKQVTLEDLQVMDQTAITLCKENNIPVIVFSIAEPGNILRAAQGEAVGTTVCSWDETNDLCVPRNNTSSGTVGF